MEEKQERSYAKESTKTTPSGIRFDKEQLEFIQKREPKLTTKQKVVDFLLNMFWWQHKVSVPSHKGLPPMTEKSEKVETAAQELPIVKRAYKSPQQYVNEKREMDDPDQYQKWFEELESDPYLTQKEKSLVKQS